jgi:hypothetical protein
VTRELIWARTRGSGLTELTTHPPTTRKKPSPNHQLFQTYLTLSEIYNHSLNFSTMGIKGLTALITEEGSSLNLATPLSSDWPGSHTAVRARAQADHVVLSPVLSLASRCPPTPVITSAPSTLPSNLAGARPPRRPSHHLATL